MSESKLLHQRIDIRALYVLSGICGASILLVMAAFSPDGTLAYGWRGGGAVVLLWGLGAALLTGPAYVSRGLVASVVIETSWTADPCLLTPLKVCELRLRLVDGREFGAIGRQVPKLRQLELQPGEAVVIAWRDDRPLSIVAARRQKRRRCA